MRHITLYKSVAIYESSKFCTYMFRETKLISVGAKAFSDAADAKLKAARNKYNDPKDLFVRIHRT